MSTLAKLLVSLGLDSSAYSSGIQKAQNETKGLSGMLQTATGTALGFVGAAAGMAVASGVFGFIKDAAVGMNATLENSTLQFTTLTGNADFAAQHVKALFELGGNTPFETQSLINASATMETFGGSTLNTIANLTQFGDAAAATNKAGKDIGGHLEEIAYWSSRMNAAMASGRPVLETANSLQRLGVISPEVMNKLIAMEAAGASGAAMWATYQQGLNRFSGAMALQSQTWSGLMSSISDNARMVVATAFKPLFEQGKIALGGLLTFLNNLAASGAAERFANGLRFVIAVLIEFGGRFVAYAQLAYAWGSNIASQFAAGIAAAINLIIGVMQQIGAVIASWLAPGSPPKITPDLDKWGEEAATIYFDSWAKGDTSAFKSLASTLQTTLKNLVDVGKFSKEGVIPTLLAGRAGLGKVFSELATLGEVTQSTFDSVVASMGPAGAQIGSLIRAYANLSRATRAVDDAQSELNSTTEKYAQMLAPLNSEMKALQDREKEIKDMQRIEELNIALGDGSLDAAEQELARNEIAQINLQKQIKGVTEEKDAVTEAAQAKLDAAKVEQQVAQTQVDSQQQAIDNQNETNALIGQQIALVEQMAKAAASAAGGGGGIGGIGAAGGGMAMPTIKIPKIDTAELTNVATKIAETQAKATAFVDGIQAKFTAFGTGLAAAAAPIVAFTTMVSTGFSALVAIVLPVLMRLWSGIQLGITGITPQWGSLLATLSGLMPVITVIAQVVGAVILALVGLIAGALPGAMLAVGGAIQAVLGLVNIATAIFMGFVNIIVGLLTGDFAGAWQATLGMLNGISAGVVQIIGGLVNVFFGLIYGLVQGVIGFFQTLYETVVGGSIIPDFVDGIIEFISKLPSAVLGFISGMVTNVLAKFSQLKTDAIKFISDTASDILTSLGTLASDAIAAGKAIVDGVIKGAKSAAGSLISSLTNMAKDALNAAKSALGISSPSKVFADDVGRPIVLGIIQGFEQTLPALLSVINKGCKKMIAETLTTMAQLNRSSGLDVFKSLLDLETVPTFQPLIDSAKALEDATQDGIDRAKGLADIAKEASDVQAKIDAAKALSANAKTYEEQAKANADLTKLYDEQKKILEEQALLLAEQAKHKNDILNASEASRTAQMASEAQNAAIAKIAEDARKAYDDAQKQALAMMQTDAKGALDFFNTRKAQIEELAQLQKQRALATTDKLRADLDAQIALTKAAQTAEQAAQAVQINIGGTGEQQYGQDYILSIIKMALINAGISVDIQARMT